MAGWAYQWLAQLSFARDRWTAPLAGQRVHPSDNVNAVAGTQITRLLHRLPIDGPVPLFVFDAGYDPVQLQQGLADGRAAILVRLRSGRCFYADPPPPQGTGRPPRHGRTVAGADPTTWSAPPADHTCADEQYGTVRVRAWAGLHPKVQAHQGRGSRGPRPIVRATLVRVEVSRLPRQTREPQVRWLWWHSPGDLDLDLAWRADVRRFDLEHSGRLLQQTRGWPTLRVGHPAQADRWTWLVLAASTHLRLARGAVADRRLPWDRSLPPGCLTPCRVRRSVSALLLVLGTPARAPKPCGRSPGRPSGRCSGPAARHPAIKKAA